VSREQEDPEKDNAEALSTLRLAEKANERNGKHERPVLLEP
jgi:hypothetical protein